MQLIDIIEGQKLGCSWCQFILQCSGRSQYVRASTHMSQEPHKIDIVLGNMVEDHNTPLQVNKCFWITLNHLSSILSTLAEKSAPECLSEILTDSEVSFRGGIDSDTEARQILHWLEECRTHSECPRQEKKKLPRRVIDVGPEGQGHTRSKLVQLNERFDYYATLSYCWGQRQAGVTTKANVMSRLESLDEESLSQTVRDAITITRRIGIRYLWVDAICIIQDSDDDKASEIQNMSSIYEGALVTVVAVSASTSTEGFPQTYRTPTDHIRIPGWGPQDQLTSLSIRREELHKKQNEPIDQRAWTFQEALLSSRCLNFANSFLQYECRHHAVSLGAAINFPEDRYLNYPSKSMPLFLSSWTDTGTSWMWFWASVTSEYSQRNLSFPRDKLNALSAVANMVHSRLHTRYLAGLWDGPLLPGLLLWKCEPSSSESTPIYIAPSWSWASRRTTASYPIEVQRAMSTWYDAEVKKVDCQLERESLPFGSVLSGRLEFRGRVRKGFYVARDGTIYWDVLTENEGLENGRSSKAKIQFDLDSLGKQARLVHCLATTSFARESDRGAIWVSGLIVSKTAEQGHYQRDGVFWQAEEEEFCHCNFVDLVLV